MNKYKCAIKIFIDITLHTIIICVGVFLIFYGIWTAACIKTDHDKLKYMHYGDERFDYATLFEKGKFIDVDSTVDLQDVIVIDSKLYATDIFCHDFYDIYSIPMKLKNGKTQRILTIQPMFLEKKKENKDEPDYIKIKGKLLVNLFNKPLNNKYILKDATIITNNGNIAIKNFETPTHCTYVKLKGAIEWENYKRTVRVQKEQNRREQIKLFGY